MSRHAICLSQKPRANHEIRFPGRHRIRIALHKHDVGRFLFGYTPDTRQDPVGPVGFSEWGLVLVCWLSRVLVSPAGSTGFVETLKKIPVHPSRTWSGSSPYPAQVRRFGGALLSPLRSSPFGTCSFSPQYSEAQKPNIRRRVVEVHGTNDYGRGFLMGKNSKILLRKLEKCHKN